MAVNHAFDLDTYEQCLAAERLRKTQAAEPKPQPEPEPRRYDAPRVLYPTIESWLKAINGEPYNAVEEAKQDVERDWLCVGLTYRRIIREIAERHGFTYEQVISASRKAKVIACRFEAICEVHKAYPHLSLARLGKIFKRDHTSILHALQKHGLKPPPKGKGEQA